MRRRIQTISHATPCTQDISTQGSSTMNGISAATPPGSFCPDFPPFGVFAPDGSGIALTIETILADPKDNCLILGCHKTSLGHAPYLVKHSFSGERDLSFGTNGYAFIDIMGDADPKDMGADSKCSALAGRRVRCPTGRGYQSHRYLSRTDWPGASAFHPSRQERRHFRRKRYRDLPSRSAAR